MESLQQIIQRKLLEKKTGIITPTTDYRQEAMPYDNLSASGIDEMESLQQIIQRKLLEKSANQFTTPVQTIPQPTINVPEKSSIIQRIGEYVSPQPGQVRPVDVIREIPEALGTIASKGLGYLSSAAGGLFGFLAGEAISSLQQSKDIITGKKKITDYSMADVYNSGIDYAKESAKQSQKLGEQIAPIVTIGAVPYVGPVFLAGLGVYITAKGVQSMADEFGTVYENRKMYGKNNPKLIALDLALRRGSSEGWKLTGLDDDQAKQVSDNPLFASIGNALLAGVAYGTYKGISRGIQKPIAQYYSENITKGYKPTELYTIDFKAGKGTVVKDGIKTPITFEPKNIPGKLQVTIGRSTGLRRATEPLTQGTTARQISYQTQQPRIAEPIEAKPVTVEPTLPTRQIPQQVTAAPIIPQLGVAVSRAAIVPEAPTAAFQMLDEAQIKAAKILQTKLQTQLKKKQELLTTGRTTPAEIKKIQSIIQNIEIGLKKAERNKISGTGPEVKGIIPQEPAISRNIPIQLPVISQVPRERVARPEAITPEVQRIEAKVIKPIKTKVVTNKIIQQLGLEKSTDPACIKAFREVLKNNPEAKPIRGIISSDLDVAIKQYLENIKEGNQRQLEGFTHIKAEINGRLIDNNPVIPQGAKFFNETSILKNIKQERIKEEQYQKNIEELQKERVNRPKIKIKPIEPKIRATERALITRREIKQEQKKMDRKYSDMIKARQEELQKNLEARVEQTKIKLAEEKKTYTERTQAIIERQEEATGKEVRGHSIEFEITKLKQDLKDFKTAGRDKQFFQDLEFKYFQEYVDGKSKWDKSEIISDFIDENFKGPEKYDKSISLQSKLLPISEIENGLNRAWEKMIRWAYKKSSSDKVMQILKETLQKSNIINAIGRAIIYQYRLPKWYIKLKNLAESQKTAGQNTARELMAYLSDGLTNEQKINLHGAIINHGISPDADIAARAMVARQILDEFGKKFAEAGGIKMTTYEANKGQYLPRMYYSKELANPLLQWTKSGGMKASLQRAKHRGVIKIIAENKLSDYEAKGWKKIADTTYKGYIKIRRDYSESERKAMGEIIDEPGYLVARGVTQLSSDIAVLNIFKQIAILHPEVISRTPVADFKQLPQSKSYGYLSGKYVDPYIYNDIKGIIESRTIANKMGTKMLSEWKKFKIVDNPATHFRNMYFNFILSDIAGLHPYRVDIYGSALMDVWNKTDDYKFVVNNGLFSTSYVGTELKDLLIKNKTISLKKNATGVYEYTWNEKLTGSVIDFGGKILNYYNKAQAKLGNLYQAEEEWNKMALYRYAKQDLKFSDTDAIEFAKKWGLNYQAVTPWINKFSQEWYGTPFVRFKMLAAPRLIEGAIFRPVTILKWLLIFAAIEEFSRRTLGLAKSELDKIKNNIFPNWMKDGIYILMPEKDKHNNLQFLDLTYIIPYVEDIQGWNLYNYAFGNPVFRIPAEIMLNRSAFTGRDIIDKTLNPELSSQLMSYLAYVYQTIVPPLAPGGYNFDNIYNAIIQKQDYEGKTTDLISQISTSIFGLKLRSIDISKEQKFRLIELKTKYDDVASKIKSTFNNKGLNEDDKAEEITRLLQILEGLTNQASDIQKTGQSEEAAKLFSR